MASGCVRVCLALHIFLSIVTASYAGHRILNNGLNRRNAEIDSLIQDLQQEKWEQEDVPCVQAVKDMLYGVKNSTLWATWIWDSMQRPTGALYGSRYHLGNFDQCLNPPWQGTHQDLRTQHCLVEVSLTDTEPKRWTKHPDPYDNTENYLNTTSIYWRNFNKATLGVCLPEVCSHRAVAILAPLMVQANHLPEPRAPRVLSCQTGATHQYSTQFYIYILTFAILYSVAIFGTLFPEYVPTSYWASEVRKAFDMKRNWMKLFVVSSRELKSVHGIRCFSSAIIICSHYIYYSNLTPISNALHMEKDLNSFVGMFVFHIDLIVDTFFALSGMLLINGLMSGKRTNLVEGLVKRYIRIVAPLAVMVYYFSWVHEHIGSGPVWELASREQRDVCHENWWATLLMVNNYVNEDRICHTVSWYLSCDFQLAILGTLLVYIYQRDNKTGKIVIGGAAVAAILVPSLVTYYYKLSPLFFHGMQSLVNFKTDPVFLKRYIKAHCRAAAYMVGMYAGYIFSVYRPEENRNKLSKRLSILGFLAALFTMVMVYRGGGLMLHREYNALEVAAFVAFNRATWAFAVCCLIAICEYGTLPLISTYLKWDFFVPLSRLSYCLYLLHMALVYYSIHGTRAGARYDFVDMVVHGFGIWLITNWLSVGLYLTVEAPIANLSTHLFKRPTAEPVTNGKVNGTHPFKIKST
ncbi:nose resistant to fluoxetine protein 6 [Manduca sexta]|uniref:nose resistant to fluoxetine protein 6 n=1 Tax=Manduca sexta TaxID=7130 RepID=UPI00188E876A|nr:nose resistant to fluoxetine protein 6 [Manduca sexta]